MSCSACSAHVEKDVRALAGVEDVSVSLLTNSMTVTYDERALSPDGVIAAVEHAGYGASVASPGGARAQTAAMQPQDEVRGMKTRLIWSIVFTVPLFYLSMGHMMGWPLPAFFLDHRNTLAFAFTQFLLALPVAYLNRKFFINGFRTLFRGAPTMDSLIAIGSSAALVFGVFAIYRIGWGLGWGDMDTVHRYAMDLYFESAAMILTLITLGKFLEARAKGKTSEAIAKLVALRPQTALVLRDGVETEISLADVVVGDIVVVRSGAVIPVDGVVTEGTAAVDESALTGESIPVEKSAGARVSAATISRSGYLQLRATEVGDDTTLSQIIRLMEEAASSKAPIAKLADKISSVFVPAVILIAVAATVVWLLLGYPFEFALSIGISVLVISCPCALGLATPTAIMVGTGRGAQEGILIKSAEALETAHSIDTVVLDKTGTVTEGRPAVTDILTYGGMREEQALSLALAVEARSEHPLARAIMAEGGRRNLAPPEVADFQTVPGRGVAATVGTRRVWAGSAAFLEENSLSAGAALADAERLAQEGKTSLFFADEAGVFSVIAVSDPVKESSAAAIGELRAMGLDVVLLTGDNRRTAQAVAARIGGVEVHAEVMPQEKELHVRALMDAGKRVAMVGDGINDAPALARADVGVAIGAGTDIAIESADVVLVKSDLRDVATLVRLSRAVIRNIKENLFWALIYNTLGIPLAAGVFYLALDWKLNPMFAAAAMSLSSVCVVTNALRLRFFRPRPAAKGADHTIKEIKTMKKTMMIEGMMCAHCSGRVEAALNALDGVTAHVDLAGKRAQVTLTKDVTDDALRKAVTDAGYTVTAIGQE